METPVIAGLRAGARVVITAGAGGIGRVIAETFHAHGARVHVCDVSREHIASLQDALPEVGAILRTPRTVGLGNDRAYAL